ncbi:hypothetical protein GE09DRAFT_18357 [Coniochaeta sp. 2T2.1]|nr:hypothetical protein GE09DRAFT_18357 [Coniochaeta sp. 2T2.1]
MHRGSGGERCHQATVKMSASTCFECAAVGWTFNDDFDSLMILVQKSSANNRVANNLANAATICGHRAPTTIDRCKPRQPNQRCDACASLFACQRGISPRSRHDLQGNQHPRTRRTEGGIVDSRPHGSKSGKWEKRWAECSSLIITALMEGMMPTTTLHTGQSRSRSSPVPTQPNLLGPDMVESGPARSCAQWRTPRDVHG